MPEQYVPVPDSLQFFVKNIVVMENYDSGETDILPFYADGFPGILYKESVEAPVLMPRAKKLSELFVYGQTIKPIEIHFQTPYKVIVFELHPYAVKMLFGVNPTELNDDCYNFLSNQSFSECNLLTDLTDAKETTARVDLIAAFLEREIKRQSASPYVKIKQALDLIISEQGKVAVKNLADQLAISERTLQRLFIEHVGIPPKQFAKIIQFQSSLSEISDAGLQKLTEVVYKFGYSDQSHFIRDFKKYAGNNPSSHKKKKAL